LMALEERLYAFDIFLLNWGEWPVFIGYVSFSILIVATAL